MASLPLPDSAGSTPSSAGSRRSTWTGGGSWPNAPDVGDEFVAVEVDLFDVSGERPPF